MKKLLVLLTLLMLLTLPALADASVTEIVITSTRFDGQCAIHDEAAINLLLGLLKSPEEPCDAPTLPSRAADYEVVCHQGEQHVIYQVYHDDLYNEAWLLDPAGTTFRIGCELPKLLNNASSASPDLSIPEAHRTLLAEHGWTIAFRQGCMYETLPASLTASRTDPSALHFTWASLFLQDAGYDITPWLGITVLPYVYYLVEPVNRVRWVPSDIEIIEEFGHGGVLYSVKAVVLECDGMIIGAYLMAVSWDGSDLMSLTGHTAIDLLGKNGVRSYLLARSVPDAELAALTPEEVIQRYSETHDPHLETIDGLLRTLGTSYGSGLYSRGTYRLETLRPDPAVSIRALRFDNMYEVCTEKDELWFPQLEWESDQTGWKIVHYYNTGV